MALEISNELGYFCFRICNLRNFEPKNYSAVALIWCMVRGKYIFWTGFSRFVVIKGYYSKRASFMWILQIPAC